VNEWLYHRYTAGASPGAEHGAAADSRPRFRSGALAAERLSVRGRHVYQCPSL
jgi:hypothetical protein